MIVSFPMGDLLTFLDTCRVHYRMAVLRNEHCTKMNCLLAWIPSVAPVLIITNSDSHHDNPIIPHTVKARAKDDQIDQIHDFLRDHIHPPDLSDSDYTSFVNAATHFFLLNWSPYRREQHRRHQLVVPVECCYRLIQEAHNSLRHKGVFSVWTHLLLCFW